ncbi:heparinase II/III family protein [Anaerobacillus sp. CMMVII]|uniref:heparinase II/III domain-containing protein n=1 Tax=Anaerobacillus sp. CMMVII TaxID=2755588 RepID=UPI0028E0A301|nr:heparinase II/III family protein [Anaerobacillus sp. CMMVII]
MDDPNEHIMYLTKSSQYGSISHSHGDQNAFMLHAFGEPLAIHSGYYVAFNSTMHMNWRRQTISKNAILIDGKGQFADKDKFIAMEANGKIEAVEDHENYAYIRSNATNAYQYHVPYLKKFVRETYFVNNSYFVLIDTIDLEQPGKVDWLLHSLHEMKIKHQSFLLEGEKATLEGKFVYCSSGELEVNQYNDYPGVDLREIEGLPIHWRLQAQTNKATRHRIVTLLHPMKKQQPKYVSYFMDDQDHGLQFYFTENNKTFRIEVAKVY